ncbi:MAG TPA: tetratricopeptide repeat protein [Gemmataceae bacterium]|nr:tetratricopeptide repeat protein [Gemmataceae bacterium]
MSRTLHLIRRLLAHGRKLHKLGVNHEASLLLNRLAGLGELPPGVAEEVQRRLAELSLKQRRYPRARRHLAALLLHQPDNSHYHYLMGRAVEKDNNGDPKRAAMHYRRALELRPDHPRYLTSFGLAALRIGRKDSGLRSLRRALEVAPDDPLVLARVVEGLSERRRYREALTAMRAALFRNPYDPRFRKLWHDFRFTQLQRRQEATRRREAAAVAAAEGPTLLPFAPLPSEARVGQAGRRFIRHDGSPALPSPHLPLPARRKDRKHAQ